MIGCKAIARLMVESGGEQCDNSGDTALYRHADSVLYASTVCLAGFAVEVEVIHGSIGPFD